MTTRARAEVVDQVMSELLASARAALGDDLVSLVLYGSAADGKLRTTSDVNAIVLLRAFDASKLEPLRAPLRNAHAAIELNLMFLLERELPAALSAFAVKFADVLQRRKVLYGPDPFAGLAVPRAAEIARLKQVLLNLALRSRQSYLLRGLREEQMAALVADVAGPLRASAAALLALQEKPVNTPKEALEQVSRDLGPGFAEVMPLLSQARETGALAAGAGGPALLKLIELAGHMRAQVEALA